MQRRIIIFVSFLAFAFSIASIAVDTSRETIKRDAYYQEQQVSLANGGVKISGPYCFPDPHPRILYWISFLTGLTFLFSCLSKRSILSAIAALGAFLVFPYWYFDTQRFLTAWEWSRPIGIDGILYRANEFDLAVFALVSTLVLWQLTCLTLTAVKTIKRDPSLP